MCDVGVGVVFWRCSRVGGVGSRVGSIRRSAGGGGRSEGAPIAESFREAESERGAANQGADDVDEVCEGDRRAEIATQETAGGATEGVGVGVDGGAAVAAETAERGIAEEVLGRIRTEEALGSGSSPYCRGVGQKFWRGFLLPVEEGCGGGLRKFPGDSWLRLNRGIPAGPGGILSRGLTEFSETLRIE